MHDLLITAGVYSLTGQGSHDRDGGGAADRSSGIRSTTRSSSSIVCGRTSRECRRAAFSQIVNRSMSEVLTRSLATSFCTLLPVTALLLFGGETLKDFAFALMIGIASGRVLLDLHRLAGAHALEGARARLPHPPRPHRPQSSGRCPPTRPPPQAPPRMSSPSSAAPRTRRGSRSLPRSPASRSHVTSSRNCARPRHRGQRALADGRNSPPR